MVWVILSMESIRIIQTKITRDELKQIAAERYGDMVKAVVDLEKKIMAIGGEMHADDEQALLEQGSAQTELWGINLYPDRTGEDFIEFDSMVNIRPSQGNRSRGVEKPEIQMQIRNVVASLIQ